MATKKDTAEKAEKKEPAKKVTKTTKPKTPEKKIAPEQPAAEEKTAADYEVIDEKETGYEPKILKPSDVEDKPKAPAIIDDTDKILKASDIELPPEEEPAGKQKIVVSHDKSAMADDEKVEVISAEEVLKDLEYDFETHEIKPYKGGSMTSHEMHQGKYGIIDDVTKDKKKK